MIRRMVIALVIGNYDAFGGGAERWTDRHTRNLLSRGYEVHLIARHFRGAPDGAKCWVADIGALSRRRRLCFARNAELHLRTLKPDVIHDMGDGWCCDLLMPHHGTRRGGFEQQALYQTKLRQSWRQFASGWLPRYRQFQALEREQYDPDSPRLYLAVSCMIQQHMMQYHGVPKEKIRVVYNGVDVGRFHPENDSKQRTRLRRELDVGDETLFLIVAHNFRLKGLDPLLRAMGHLNKKNRKIQLLVVGDGPVNRYQHLARTCGCEHLVRFVGDQPDPLSYYQAADVFVLPTYYDPCSLVALEAMACGLPVITSRYNGVHELMSPEQEGRIISDPADDVTLSEHMSIFIDPERRQEAALAARALAEKYSIEHCLDGHLEIYQEIHSARS